jgi:DNA-directed RNA polymerase subunit RPC12/RpoP
VDSDIGKDKPNKRKKVETYDACPHCGRELSPWEKVLLSVDRMLMCKNCWYRILLEDRDDSNPESSNEK